MQNCTQVPLNLAPGEECAELLPHCDKVLLKGQDFSVDQDFSDSCHVDLYGNAVMGMSRQMS